LAVLPPNVQQAIIGLKEQTDWAQRAGNVLLIGSSGVGKSHIAAALAGQLIEQGVRVKWFSAVALVQTLQQAKRDLDLMTTMTRLDKYQVLIITSNQPFSRWDSIFPDTMMTVAAIDRIIHHSTIIEIEGDSYRKNQSLKNKPIS
jgi:DNA replication protein DnaC